MWCFPWESKSPASLGLHYIRWLNLPDDHSPYEPIPAEWRWTGFATDEIGALQMDPGAFPHWRLLVLEDFAVYSSRGEQGDDHLRWGNDFALDAEIEVYFEGMGSVLGVWHLA